MKKVNFIVSVSLFVGVVFCNSAFATTVLSSGQLDINSGERVAINADTSLNDMGQPVIDFSITSPASIVTLSGVSQIESELVNVSVTGNLYLDFSVFSSLPGLFITGNVSFISAEQTSIYMYDNTPNIDNLTDLMVFNELPVNYNDEGPVLFFSSQPITNGIFDADNIFIGNYSELSASVVPLPAAFYFFGSSLFGLAGLRLSGKSFVKNETTIS